MILSEAHVGIAGGLYAGKATVRKILQLGLWCPTMHANKKLKSWALNSES